MLIKYTTSNYKQTQKLGELLAKEVLLTPVEKRALILCLSGNLGGGKTTFLQGFSKGLGVKEKILSPTFVILKHLKIMKPKTINQIPKIKNFYHIDCYRIKNAKDILELNFKKIISDPENIIAIEWPEKIKTVLPKKIIFIKFKFVDESRREINIEV